MVCILNGDNPWADFHEVYCENHIINDLLSHIGMQLETVDPYTGKIVSCGYLEDNPPESYQDSDDY